MDKDITILVTVHGPGTGSFFGHFWPKKVPVPFLTEGDSPIFTDFAAKIGTVPVIKKLDGTVLDRQEFRVSGGR